MHKNMTENIFNNCDAYLRNLLHKFVLVLTSIATVPAYNLFNKSVKVNINKSLYSILRLRINNKSKLHPVWTNLIGGNSENKVAVFIPWFSKIIEL